MPLDSTNFVSETKPDLSKPSARGLSYLLRRYLYLWIGRDERPRRVALQEGPGP